MNLDLYRNVTTQYSGSRVNKSVLQNLAYLSDREKKFSVDVQVLARNVGVKEDDVRKACGALAKQGRISLSGAILHYVEGSLL